MVKSIRIRSKEYWDADILEYDRSGELLTVTMWCGGTFQTEGFVCYQGGSKMTFDFVHMGSLNNSTLKKIESKSGSESEGGSESVSECGSESGSESGAESENESEKNDKESEKSGKGNGSEGGKGGDCENENIEHESGNFVGENVEETENEQSELERQEDEDDFLDSDYDFRNSSSDDDDALFSENVDAGASGGEDGDSSTDSDDGVVEVPDDLDELRGDQEEPKKKGKKRRGKQPMKMKRQQPTVKCKKCGMAGHYARSCEKRKEKEMNTLSQNQSQVTQEVDNSPLKRAFDTILERKRARAAADRGKRKRAKKATVETEQSSQNPTLLPPVISHEEEDEELHSLCELIDEYEIPKVANQPGSTPYQQLQSSMQSRDEN
ncbi:sodium/potassium/calcium exchanger 1 [Striga asiatica]|uniref:Sodium/potassium/calcium exchanger 1 n=1 Tax=Striga asiatica TaxID=4170 RepID=A0A5A7Q5G0_STRAF|nr:sodium/potassium/calcium exchanger 1 [Striga asiatica]